MRLIKPLITFLIAVALSFNLSAQCNFAATTSYQGAAAPTGCAPVTLTTCAYYTEYSNVTNLTAGVTYSFTASATPSVTGPFTFGIYSSTIVGSPPVASLTAAAYPIVITYTPTVTGTYYTSCFYGGANCTQTAVVCHTYTVSCASCGQPTPVGFQPSTNSVTQNSVNNQVLRMDVVACGASTVTAVNVNTNGSTNPTTDIANAKLYYTTTGTFSTTVQFGSTITNPNGALVFTGSTNIAAGSNGYFWLTYDLTAGASVGNVIDAEGTSITLNGTPLNIVPSNPTGTRTIIAVPANDNCSGATPFGIIPTDGTCVSLTNQNTTGASNSNVTPTGSCSSNSGTPDDDIWFSFVAPATTVVLKYTFVSGTADIFTQVFSSACGPTMTSILCTDTDSGGTMTGLTVGNTYFIRMYTYGSGVVTVQNVCLRTIPPPPANDNCAGAIVLTPSANSACASSTSSSTAGATQSVGTTPTCSATGINDDVWFTFTASAAIHMVKVNYTDNATTTQVYSGTCGSLVAIGCFAGSYGNSNVLATGLTIGNTYYVRVYSSTSTATTTSDFNICITSPSVPLNDDCITATAIPCGSSISGSNALALNETLPASTCGSTGTTANAKGVWFTVTPATSGNLTVDACGSDFDNYLRVYTGGCAALTCVSNVSGIGYADAGCAVTLNNAAKVTFPCIAGTTYYILLTAYTNFGNYTISVTCPLVCTTPPTALAVSGITSNGGVISYTAPIPAPLVGYEYYYSTSSTPPTVGTPATGNTAATSFTLTGLNSNTLYYVWVRSTCGGNDVSTWAALPSFMTLPGSGCSTAITASPSANICIGGSTTLSASGTWVSYSWAGPGGFSSTNPTVVATLAGVYSLTVTASDACVTYANITVTVNPLPVVTITPAAPTLCPGSTVTLTASGGATYMWSNGSNTASTVVNALGTYTVTVTSAAGCMKSGSVTVVASPPLTATATANPPSICIGSTISLSATGGATYIWSGPAGFSSTLQNPTRTNATVAMSGTYSVTVTSAAGCTGVATAIVTVNPGPVATATAMPNPVCVGSTLNLSSSGGTSYSWSGPSGFSSNLKNPKRSNMLLSYAGTYSVTVTSGAGCSATAAVNVIVNPIPTGSATATPSIACVGSSVQFGAPAGSTYSWTGPQGFTSNQQNPLLNITSYQQEGLYKVVVTTASGCSATFTTSFKISYPPVATATYNVGSNCMGSNLSLHGTGGGSYSWSGPAGFTSNLQNPVILNVTGANSGVYTLTVGSPTGCSAVVTLNITILAAPVVTASADATEVCEGGTVYLHATAGASYQWKGPLGWESNLQNPVIQNIPAYLSGTYTVTVTNAGGCSAESSVVIHVFNFINASASATPNPAPSGSSVQLSATGGFAYLWSGPNGFFSNEQNPVLFKVSSKSAGTYVVILTNEGKCQMTLFVTLSIINAREAGSVVEVKETKVSDLTIIYPNPAKNIIKLDYKGNKSIKYNIVNANGEIILKDARSSSGTINIENLSSGTYAVVWSEDMDHAQTHIGKFIKVD